MNSEKTPHLSPYTGELWSVFVKFFGEKLPWDIERALYLVV